MTYPAAFNGHEDAATSPRVRRKANGRFERTYVPRAPNQTRDRKLSSVVREGKPHLTAIPIQKGMSWSVIPTSPYSSAESLYRLVPPCESRPLLAGRPLLPSAGESKLISVVTISVR